MKCKYPGTQETAMNTGDKEKEKEQDKDVQSLEKEMDEMTDPELLRNARRDQEGNLSICNLAIVEMAN